MHAVCQHRSTSPGAVTRKKKALRLAARTNRLTDNTPHRSVYLPFRLQDSDMSVPGLMEAFLCRGDSGVLVKAYPPGCVHARLLVFVPVFLSSCLWLRVKSQRLDARRLMRRLHLVPRAPVSVRQLTGADMKCQQARPTMPRAPGRCWSSGMTSRPSPRLVGII